MTDKSNGNDNVTPIHKGNRDERLSRVEHAVGAIIQSEKQSYQNARICAAGLDKIIGRVGELMEALKKRDLIGDEEIKAVVDITYMEGPYKEIMESPNYSVAVMSAKMMGGMHTVARQVDALTEALKAKDLVTNEELEALEVAVPTDDDEANFLFVHGGDKAKD
jgi:hypothetical protein